jgi:hypothetical protein
MTTKKAWALVDDKGDIVFLNQQAEIYNSYSDAEVGNAEQDSEYSIAPCTLTCAAFEKDED